jgi:hypothetical protein
MSTIIMSKCWPLTMSATQKSVLISLADNANDHGVCWPSIPTIAMRTCLSERSIHGAIKWLETYGVLKANRANGRHTSYTVWPESFEPPQELRPRSKRATATDAATTAANAVVPPQTVQKPPQEVRSNRKEPSIEPTKNHKPSRNRDGNKFNALQFLKDKGVQEQHANDWLVVRKDKKLPPTQTALEDIEAEVEKSGLTFDDAIKACCIKGWGGFKASWLINLANGQTDSAGMWWSTASSIEAEADKMGLKRNAEEPMPALRARVQAAKEAKGEISNPPRSRADLPAINAAVRTAPGYFSKVLAESNAKRST